MPNNTDTIIIPDLEKVFKSTDPNCPVLSFGLTDPNDQQKPLIDSTVSITSSAVKITSQDPKAIQFQILATTTFSTTFQKFSVQVCGDETISLVSNQPIIIQITKESTQAVIKQADLSKYFEVSNKNCPIIKYWLSETETESSRSNIGTQIKIITNGDI